MNQSLDEFFKQVRVGPTPAGFAPRLPMPRALGRAR
jgi:hypothetical protein